MTLIDELKRIGLSEIQRLVVDPVRGHNIKEYLPTLVGHGADAPRKAVTGVGNAVGLHFLNRLGQKRIGYLRVVLFDQRVARRRISIKIGVPTLDTCFHKGADFIRIFCDLVVACQNEVA